MSWGDDCEPMRATPQSARPRVGLDGLVHALRVAQATRAQPARLVGAERPEALDAINNQNRSGQ